MNSKTYIIGEVGINHNGSTRIAKTLIKALGDAGVDAVKFQLSQPEALYSKDSFKPKYQKKNESSATPIEMSRRYRLSYDEHLELYHTCLEHRIAYMCSAFDLKSLEFLDQNFKLPYFKIASGEIFSVDQINYIAQRNRPIILSTGMATFDEIEHAMNLLNQHVKKDITLLHCVSNYPAPISDMNLNLIPELGKRFRVKVGLSDHSLGILCAVAAVALGATIIEKHVTLDNNLEGPDHKASATVDEFSEMIQSIRTIEKAMGSGEKSVTKGELEIKRSVRKSIIAKRQIDAGEVISIEDICFKRPGTGISPLDTHLVIGKRAKKILKADRIIPMDCLE